MGTVLVDGKEIRCAAVVKREPRFTFTALSRRTETRAVCLHWTGGRNAGPGLFRTLQKRGLSVQFGIDPDGTIWQFADAALRCSHATGANSWSIGVEMTNPARPQPASGDAPRAVVVENIHGHDLQHTTFTVDQVRAALELSRALCTAYGLPLAVPMDGRGVLGTVMPKPALDAFRGVIGHLHLTTRKNDPGLAILRAVAALDPVNGRMDGEDLGPVRVPEQQ